MSTYRAYDGDRPTGWEPPRCSGCPGLSQRGPGTLCHTCKPDAPALLLVLDALRDPEVRAGRQYIELSNDAARCRLRVHGPDGAIELRWWHVHHWLEWKPYRLTIADLDAPCRLVPAEEAP